MKGPLCPDGNWFEYAVQQDPPSETIRRLFKCKGCGRVARTTRPHQLPNENTASHDRTMAILWDSAKLRGEVGVFE